MEEKSRLQKILDYYNENYNCLTFTMPLEKSYIDTKQPGICRFCGRDESQVTFKNIAHAIPEFFGNKTLLTACECDECNKKFGIGGGIEDNLAKLLSIYRTAGFVKGKNGLPSFKNKKGDLRIDPQENLINLDCNKDYINIDKLNKYFTITTETPKFIPLLAYKAFLKIALSIMPDEELVWFKSLINFVNTDELKATALCHVMQTTTSGYKPYSTIQNLLFIRKNDKIMQPYMYYVLMFGNLLYQVVVPSTIKDKELFKQNLTVKWVPFPSPYCISSEFKSSTQKVDLSGTEPVNIPVSVRFRYENIEISSN